LLDLTPQVPVGGGDDANVYSDQLRSTQAPELVGLQHTQELHLAPRRHLADLIEE